MEKWDRRFLELSKHVSEWSKDPSTKVGSVIVDDSNRVISLGYNGFPKNIQDLPERYNNRDLKLKMVLHAEENALLFSRQPLDGCTIYIWPFLSCSTCTIKIIQTGIKRVVAPSYMPDKWKDSFELSMQLLEEAGVELTLY